MPPIYVIPGGRPGIQPAVADTRKRLDGVTHKTLTLFTRSGFHAARHHAQ